MIGIIQGEVVKRVKVIVVMKKIQGTEEGKERPSVGPDSILLLLPTLDVAALYTNHALNRFAQEAF